MFLFKKTAAASFFPTKTKSEQFHSAFSYLQSLFILKNSIQNVNSSVNEKEI